MDGHCPGCRGYTRGWEDECPGLLAGGLAPVLPLRVPLDMAGHRVLDGDGNWLDCHCRWGRDHHADDPSPW